MEGIEACNGQGIGEGCGKDMCVLIIEKEGNYYIKTWKVSRREKNMLRLKRRRVGEGRRGVWKKLAILMNNTEFDWIYIHYTVRPNKHENSVTMLKNLSTLPLLAGSQPLHTFILQPSWVEVD